MPSSGRFGSGWRTRGSQSGFWLAAGSSSAVLMIEEDGEPESLIKGEAVNEVAVLPTVLAGVGIGEILNLEDDGCSQRGPDRDEQSGKDKEWEKSAKSGQGFPSMPFPVVASVTPVGEGSSTVK